ncbi:hypothetical protein ACKUB1_14860 [Methanospirillum stamsii]|uniref:Uncharacterized protein n=1 Tax=Methanospirillum stamsii TaxID=1277351 RepID=A0A2V2NCG4_9EURY|nr:hypothetical protein [Methanospirillum stamsii]PWR75296.1 hypothetical protein DLD82_05805 [Methanospirillum stamsii]
MNYRFVLTLIILVLFVIFSSPVSAYYLTIDAPAQVKVGEPINVSGSTNTPPPDRVDIVFSKSINVPVEIERQSIEITEKGDNSFNVTFQTTGLEKGNYKVEGLSESKRDFSAGSRSLRVIKLVDRSDLITFTSPTWQEFEKELDIEAKISGYKENAIQMEVKKDEVTLFGPESIPVSHGAVDYELPIEEPGSYSISFSDYDGFIGTYTIVSEEKDNYRQLDTEQVQTPEKTAEITTEPTKINTDEGNEKKEISKEKSGKITGISASTEVSRDSPAYFLILTNSTPISIQSSDNEDYVLEYKTTEDGAVVKVNDEMGKVPETITISDSVSEIYLKVYPYSYKSSEKVTISTDSGSSIELSDKAAKAFGVPPRYGNSDDGAGKETPLPFWLVLMSIGLSLIISKKRK